MGGAALAAAYLWRLMAGGGPWWSPIGSSRATDARGHGPVDCLLRRLPQVRAGLACLGHPALDRRHDVLLRVRRLRDVSEAVTKVYLTPPTPLSGAERGEQAV